MKRPICTLLSLRAWFAAAISMRRSRLAFVAAILASGAWTLGVSSPAVAASQAAAPKAEQVRPDTSGAGTPELDANQLLTSGQELVDGSMAFQMGSDGNVVLTDDGHAVWANGETGNSGAHLTMQGDGNLVEGLSGTAIWNTGTSGDSGAYLTISQYGYPRIIYNSTYVWNTPYPNTYFSPTQQDVLFGGQSLGAPGQTMYDAKKGYSLYEYEGWLEEYVNGTNDLVWSAGSYCSGSSEADMQTDGNLVIYCNGVATWSSGTGGHPASYGFYLHLMVNGTIVISSNYGGTEWSS